MKRDKSDRITVRFDPAVGRKIRALARQRGLSVADYCRSMCMLEVLNEDPYPPVSLAQQQLKETLADMQAFASLDPRDQAEAMRRSLDAITEAKKAADKAFTWLYALATASDAVINQKGEPDASTGHAGHSGPADAG